MRAGLHYASFHRGENERGEPFGIDGTRQPVAVTGNIQAVADMLYPTEEIHREQLAHRWIGLVKLERQRSDWTAVRAAAAIERSTVQREQRKHFGNWIVNAFPRRRQQHRHDAVAICLEHCEKQILFGWEEVIELPEWAFDSCSRSTIDVDWYPLAAKSRIPARTNRLRVLSSGT